MTKVPNIFGPLSYFWQHPNMVHWHVTFYVMSVYCTFMKMCMQNKKNKKKTKKQKKQKKIEEKFLSLLLMTLLHYCYRLYDYT